MPNHMQYTLLSITNYFIHHALIVMTELLSQSVVECLNINATVCDFVLHSVDVCMKNVTHVASVLNGTVIEFGLLR